MDGPIQIIGVVASLSLVLVAVALSWWQGIGVERSILWAGLRAALQLLAVGVVLRLIFDSALATWWAWLWVLVMVVIAGEAARRRSPGIPGLRAVVMAAIGASSLAALALVFGLRIFEFAPITLVVIAGITIGNTMPSTILAVDRAVAYVRDNRLQIEGLLALGFDGRGATRFLVQQTARTALIPQIERTKVVGLIALPGAMTGLLLAGVEPLTAVLVQLAVMYLILGSVAIAVVVVVSSIAARTLTQDLRLEAWSRP